jgi:hypothetical protein
VEEPNQSRAVAAPSRSPIAHSLLPLRVLAAGVALLCLTPLVLAAFLTPAAAGHGTHAQLGMPPCGWAMYFNKPCVTCGMTTAFAHAVKLQLWDAWIAQPMGLALAVLCGLGFWASAHTACTGSALLAMVARGIASRRMVILLVVATAGAWAWKWSTWTGF